MRTASSFQLNQEKSRRFFYLTLLYTFPILSHATIRAKIDGYEFWCLEDNVMPYTRGTTVCTAQFPSLIVRKDQPIFGEPDTLPISNLLAVRYDHSDDPYHTTTLRDLLWPELVTLPNRTIEDEDGREIHLYENITISSLLPNEESILSCVFDMLLLYADAQANGYIIVLDKYSTANFDISPSSPHCYLPSLVHSAQKTLHNYISKTDETGQRGLIGRAYNVWGMGMDDLAELLHNICKLERGLSYSFEYLRCRDPRFELLYEMLLKHSYLKTASFLDIASLVSVFPDLPLAKKKKWLRYLEYRGYKEALTAKNPVVAFVDGVVHPMFSYFAPHAVLEATTPEKGAVPIERPGRGENPVGSEKAKSVLTVLSERKDVFKKKEKLQPSIYSIMSVSKPHHLGHGGTHLIKAFRHRWPLERYDNNSTNSLKTKRDRFIMEKHEKRIKQNFFALTGEKAKGLIKKKEKGTVEMKEKETIKKKPTLANFTVISLPLYSWRIAQDNVLDGKSREDILSSLEQAVKEKIQKFSTEFAKCNMWGYEGDPTTILQFLGEQKPPKLPKSLQKPLLSHEKRTSLVIAAHASYHFMKKRNPSSHKKFLEVHPLVLRALASKEKEKLNTFILANCEDNKYALHTALDSAVSFYLTFLHYTFYDEMRVFMQSFLQLEDRRYPFHERLFSNYRYSDEMENLPTSPSPNKRLFPLIAQVNILRRNTSKLIKSLSPLSILFHLLQPRDYKIIKNWPYDYDTNQQYKRKDFIRMTQSREKAIFKARSVIQKEVAEYLKGTDLKGIWDYLVNKDSFKLEFETPISNDFYNMYYIEATNNLHTWLWKYPGLRKYPLAQLMSILHFLNARKTYCARLAARDEQVQFNDKDHLIAIEALDEPFLAKLTSLSAEQAKYPIFLYQNGQIVSRVDFEKLEVDVSYENLNKDINDFCSLLGEKHLTTYWEKADKFMKFQMDLIEEDSSNRLSFYIPRLVAQTIQWLETLKTFVEEPGIISSF